jgi:NADH dehydrogenase FAD-containing subunit
MESVRARRSGVEFIQGWGNDVNFNEKSLEIEEAAMRVPQNSVKVGHTANSDDREVDPEKKGRLFNLNYDKLVVAVGCYSQTFGTPGVRENALFLKDVTDAVKIRRRILECWLLTFSYVVL